jgi:hypothetical protein
MIMRFNEFANENKKSVPKSKKKSIIPLTKALDIETQDGYCYGCHSHVTFHYYENHKRFVCPNCLSFK